MKANEIVVEIDGINFDDSSFWSNNQSWKGRTLVNAAKDCPVFELPLIGVDIGVNPWITQSIRDHAQHMKRVMTTDLKYPVILDNYGYICDGWHRVVKALLLGRSTILAKRLISMPEPDAVKSDKGD